MRGGYNPETLDLCFKKHREKGLNILYLQALKPINPCIRFRGGAPRMQEDFWAGIDTILQER